MTTAIKPKWLLLMIALLPLELAFAQKKLEEQIALQGAEKLILQVDDTDLIRIEPWNQSDIAITATVNINENENNDAYQIKIDRETQAVSVEAAIENEDSLPKRITLHQDGQDYILNASSKQDAVVQQFIREKGGYDWMSQGVQREIQLTVRVPTDVVVDVKSKFGTVEIAQITGPMSIESKFGDIDVNIDPAAALSLTTSTKFGTVYTDLDWELKKNDSSLTLISGSDIEGTLNGGGTPLQLEAKFGNVYLRAKQQ